MLISTRLSVMAVVLFMGGALASGQTGEPGVHTSVGFHLGHSWLSGEWKDHRYAGVAFFIGSMVFGGELAFRLSDHMALALNGGYSQLDQSDWQEYARSRGDDLTASASITYFSVLLRPYLRNTAPDLIMLDIGPLILLARGSEKIDARTFDYDFFGTVRWGGQGALEYCRCLGQSFGVSLRLAGIVVPSAIQYADGESRTLVAFPVTIGVRLFL